MIGFQTRLRVVIAALFGALLFGLPALPQEAAEPDAGLWQDVITGQIEAFRAGDSAAALVFAGSGFKAAYPNPARFVRDIVRGGYGPIVDSLSHNFGEYQLVEEGLVLQLVRLVGPDQALYEALYQLGAEEEGWRVWSVALRKSGGVAI